jgi:hypothetical protein
MSYKNLISEAELHDDGFELELELDPPKLSTNIDNYS